MDGEKLVEANPYFVAALKEAGAYSDALMEEVTRKGSIAHIGMLPEVLRDVFVTAMDIEPLWHLKMQATFQKYTDNAVSKTVNLPNTATQEDIREIYQLAYELGCKGVTVYRDGCKSNQVLYTGDAAASAAPKASSRVRVRPDLVFGFTQKVKTGLGELYLTVNEIDGKPFEVFATIGKSGRSVTAKAEAIGRLVSLALRSGVDVADIVGQLKGIGGENPVFQKKGLLLSIPDAVAWVLGNRYLQGQNFHDDTGNLVHPQCPDCGADLVFEEGCHARSAGNDAKCPATRTQVSLCKRLYFLRPAIAQLLRAMAGRPQQQARRKACDAKPGTGQFFSEGSMQHPRRAPCNGFWTCGWGKNLLDPLSLWQLSQAALGILDQAIWGS